MDRRQPSCAASPDWVDRLDDADRSALVSLTHLTVRDLDEVSGRLGDLWAFALERGAPGARVRDIEVALDAVRSAMAHLRAAARSAGTASHTARATADVRS